jgi:hypothetical protein
MVNNDVASSLIFEGFHFGSSFTWRVTAVAMVVAVLFDSTRLWGRGCVGEGVDGGSESA